LLRPDAHGTKAYSIVLDRKTGKIARLSAPAVELKARFPLALIVVQFGGTRLKQKLVTMLN
jgi:hypothetical protein